MLKSNFQPWALGAHFAEKLVARDMFLYAKMYLQHYNSVGA